MNSIETKFEKRQLLAVDRCDRCSAAAKKRLVKIIETAPLEILFCDHHFQKHQPNLLINGWWLQDE